MPWLAREIIYCFYRFHCSALHGDRWAAGREAHANFAEESTCLMADDVCNEIVRIHDHRRYWKWCLCTRRHSEHWRKIFSFSLRNTSAGIFSISLLFSFTFPSFLLFTVRNNVPQKTSEEKLQGLRSGERVGQIRVITGSLCFCFLPVTSPIVLSLYTKEWIVVVL